MLNSIALTISFFIATSPLHAAEQILKWDLEETTKKKKETHIP